MNKTQQSAYHNILQGFQNMADEHLKQEIQEEELQNVSLKVAFFLLRQGKSYYYFH